MYLISIYFDEKANSIITRYIQQVAKESGNGFMTDNQIPPHITLSAFEIQDEAAAIQVVQEMDIQWKQEKIQYVSVGTFLPYVMYITPVLNEYLHYMSQSIYEALQRKDGVNISRYYRPFQWLPHTTIGKKLSKEEMKKAFEIMQNHFSVFEATVVKIGLAKTNPYQDVWEYRFDK